MSAGSRIIAPAKAQTRAGVQNRSENKPVGRVLLVISPWSEFCYLGRMNAIVKEIIGRAERWSAEDQEELAQVALEIELRRRGAHRASLEELEAIDLALAAVARGEFAADADIEALLAKYRGA